MHERMGWDGMKVTRMETGGRGATREVEEAEVKNVYQNKVQSLSL